MKAVLMAKLDEFLKLPTEITDSTVLPVLTKEIVESLCLEAEEAFGAQPIVLELRSPLVIVGDIHGQLGDMLRLIREHGIRNQYLFLGDYVDRGPHSTHCAILCFLLKLIYPWNFHFIRGNHEFYNQAGDFNFKNEIIKVFEQLPLCAIVNSEIFCVHGGVGPEVMKLNDIRMLQRPIFDCRDPLVADLMWSDPSPDVKDFGDSYRGIGSLYGEDGLRMFLNRNGFTKMVRAHQYVESGTQEHFGGIAVTVFSSSNYMGRGNVGKFYEIEAPARKKVFSLRPKVVPAQTGIRRITSSSKEPIHNVAIPGTERTLMGLRTASVQPERIRQRSTSFNGVPL